ncbi:MAG: light-harvesting antenna LH1, beta subunit [Pseudomonadota bacterium]
MSNEERLGPEAYLTPEEAKEFHKLFVASMGFFTAVAVVAHVLVWMWKPWFPDTPGYAMLNDGVQVAQATLTAFLA